MNKPLAISFLGGGNMASALIGGLIRQGMAPEQIQVVDIAPSSCQRLQEHFGVRALTTADAQVFACDALVLAVKPQQMREALTTMASNLDQQWLISVAAGLRLVDLSRWSGGYARIIRVMPNVPALIGSGVSGLYGGSGLDAAGQALAEYILGAVGSVVWVKSEQQLDVVTALSGSGPAYVFYFIEALEEAGIEQGLDAATARQLSLDTVLGAAQLLSQSGDAPARLREQVSSPGGTTVAALQQLTADALPAMVSRAVKAALQRAGEIGDELGEE